MPHATKNSIRSQSKLIPHNNRYCCGERTCFQGLCHAAGITFWCIQPRRSDGRWAWPQMPYPPCRAVRCRIPARWLRCARCPNTRQTNSFIWFQQTFLDNDPLKKNRSSGALPQSIGKMIWYQDKRKYLHKKSTNGDRSVRVGIMSLIFRKNRWPLCIRGNRAIVAQLWRHYTPKCAICKLSIMTNLKVIFRANNPIEKFGGQKRSIIVHNYKDTMKDKLYFWYWQNARNMLCHHQRLKTHGVNFKSGAGSP